MRTTCAGITAGRQPVQARGSRRSLLVLLTSLVVLVLIVLGAPAAVAHTELTGTTPGEGEVLAQAPATITLSFNEPVGASAETVQVYTPAGDPVAGQVQALDSTVTMTPATTLGSGTHTVVWRVTSADGSPATSPTASKSSAVSGGYQECSRSTTSASEGMRRVSVIS